MIDIPDFNIADRSDPDWIEAQRLATNLLAARIGGGEALPASYQDVLRWVNNEPVSVVVKRLVSLTEAMLRIAQTTLIHATVVEGLDDQEIAQELAELLDAVVRTNTKLEAEGEGEGFTATT